MRRRLTTSLLLAAVLATFTAVPASAQLAGMTTLEPEVIDPGLEPRQELRYRFVEGQADTMTMDLTMAVANSMDGVALTDVTLDISAEIDVLVTDVFEDGSARVTQTFVDYRFADTGDAATDAELQDISDQMEGLSLWQLVDERGAVLDVGVESLGSLTLEMEEQVLGNAMAVQPLPEEPVGLGARWTSAGTIVSEGLPMDMTVETEVLELDEEGVVLGLTMTGAAGLDDAFAGQMMPGVEVSIDRFDLDGVGTTSVDFGALIPDSQAEVDMILAMSVSGMEGGELVEVGVGFDMTMDMEVRAAE